MILLYQKYKNKTGKVIQHPLRLSEEFKYSPNSVITIIAEAESLFNSGPVPGYLVIDETHRDHNGEYMKSWLPTQLLLSSFDLEEPPVFKKQLEMFDYIWNTRFHVSQLTGKPLYDKGHMLWHHHFLHILPKGTYKHWKLNPYNILLARPEEHNIQERYPYFLEVRQNLTLEYHLKYK